LFIQSPSRPFQVEGQQSICHHHRNNPAKRNICNNTNIKRKGKQTPPNSNKQHDNVGDRINEPESIPWIIRPLNLPKKQRHLHDNGRNKSITSNQITRIKLNHLQSDKRANLKRPVV